MLALVLCGHSATKLGSAMWDKHPTLRALITMVTAGRFRFPTIDCDETARAEMKRLEKAARDSVSINAILRYSPLEMLTHSRHRLLNRKRALLRYFSCLLSERREEKRAKVHVYLVVCSSNNKRKKLLKKWKVCFSVLFALFPSSLLTDPCTS